MRIVLILALFFASGPALALSCMRPDVARSYQNAAQAEDIYVVVRGRLTFDEGKLPKSDGTAQGPETVTIPARFDGKALSKVGFETAFARDITLEVVCFGPWCGGAKSGVPYLAFLEKRGEDYVMVADPCGSWAFSEPSEEQVNQVESCMAGSGCEPLE